MNAPERRIATPIIVALIGARGSGRKTVAKLLKHKQGFAVAHFIEPISEAARHLYGISPMEAIFEPEKVIDRLGKSPADLMRELRHHAEKNAGPQLLMQRLSERTMARGEFRQQDLIITDASTGAEIDWVRSVGGFLWWIRRGPVIENSPFSELVFSHYKPGDMAVSNDGSIESLEARILDCVQRCKERTDVPVA